MHNFVKLKKSVKIIQHATRAWISRKHNSRSDLAPDTSDFDAVNATIVVQKCIHGWKGRSIYFQRVTQLEKLSIAFEENAMNELQTKAASAIQLYWRKFLVRRSLCCRHLAASKIQSCYRGWFARKHFVSQKQAVVKIQSVFRCLRSLRDVQRYKIATRSAILVQSHVCGWIARRGVRRLKYLIVVLQVAAEHVQVLNAVRSKLPFLVTISDMELMKNKLVMLPREDALLDGSVVA